MQGKMSAVKDSAPTSATICQTFKSACNEQVDNGKFAEACNQEYKVNAVEPQQQQQLGNVHPQSTGSGLLSEVSGLIW